MTTTSMTAKQQLLEAVEGHQPAPFLSLIQGHEKKRKTVDLEEVVLELSRGEVKHVWGCLQAWADEQVTAFVAEHHNQNEEIAASGTNNKDQESTNKYNEKLLEGIVKFAHIYISTFKEGTTFIPGKMLEMTLLLHEMLAAFNGSVKLAIVSLCEQWWLQELEAQDLLVTNVLSHLLEATTRNGAQKKEVLRLWKLHNALATIDLDSPNNKKFVELLTYCISCPIFLNCDEGIKWLVGLFSWPSLIPLLHKEVRLAIPECTRAHSAKYGEVYFKAWKASQGDTKKTIEEECIQDLMYTAIHANPMSSRPSANLHHLLHHIHSYKKHRAVSSLITELYQPILWRSFTVANGYVRMNATGLLCDAFPLNDYNLSQEEQSNLLERQYHTLKTLLLDPCHLVRITAVKGVFNILCKYWIMVPNEVIKAIFKTLLTVLVYDVTTAEVRLEVIKGLTLLLGSADAVPFLIQVLPRLGDVFDDANHKVREAFAKLLLKVKESQALKYWDIVSVPHLLHRLELDNPKVAQLVSRLLLSSFHPFTKSDEELLQRSLSLLEENRMAARRFYQYAGSMISLPNVVHFMLLLWLCLSNHIALHRQQQQQQQQQSQPQPQPQPPQQQTQHPPQPQPQQRPSQQQGYPAWPGGVGPGYSGPGGQYSYGYSQGNSVQTSTGSSHSQSPLAAHKSSSYHPMQNNFTGPYGGSPGTGYPPELANRGGPGQQGYAQNLWYASGGARLDSKSGWNLWSNQVHQPPGFPQSYSPYSYSAPGQQPQKAQLSGQLQHSQSSQKPPQQGPAPLQHQPQPQASQPLHQSQLGHLQAQAPQLQQQSHPAQAPTPAPPTQQQPLPQSQPAPPQTQPPPSQPQPPPSQTQPPTSQSQPPPSQTQPPPSQTQPPPQQAQPPPQQAQSTPPQTQPTATQTPPQPQPTLTQPPLTQTHPQASQTQPPSHTQQPSPLPTPHSQNQLPPTHTQQPSPLPHQPSQTQQLSPLPQQSLPHAQQHSPLAQQSPFHTRQPSPLSQPPSLSIQPRPLSQQSALRAQSPSMQAQQSSPQTPQPPSLPSQQLPVPAKQSSQTQHPQSSPLGQSQQPPLSPPQLSQESPNPPCELQLHPPPHPPELEPQVTLPPEKQPKKELPKEEVVPQKPSPPEQQQQQQPEKPVKEPVSTVSKPVKTEETPSQKESQPVTNNTLPKKPVYKIGPKSKTLAAKQYSQIDDLDNYKCTITVHENGSVNGYGVQPTHPLAVKSNSSPGDSSDSEVNSEDGSPTFAQLRPAKRRRKSQTLEGVFIGPKRVKQARIVRERQERRNRSLQEQLRQTELEEEIQAIRIEKSSEEDGPLGNMLVQSSIILADSQMEEQDNVEQCIASIKAHQLGINSSDLNSDLENGDKLNASSPGQVAGKRSKRSHTSKVFHNDNSVIIKHLPPTVQKRKLRAKDFKWSHYIKSMRYWCSDCAHGFRNQREVASHTEDKCKWNCLYMLECYVIVKDAQYHAHYGPKVQELLEEYQVDGQHKCKTCGEIIARKADFLVHVDSHKDFMPWECTICGTRFKIRGSLKEHLRYTHMKGRVPCLKCNKVFPTSTLLRQHVKVHTQHYKYKATKNRDEELKAAMEATAGALEASAEAVEEEAEKLSDEANEYRSWCKLMELNAMKNIGANSNTPPSEEKKKSGATPS